MLHVTFKVPLPRMVLMMPGGQYGPPVAKSTPISAAYVSGHAPSEDLALTGNHVALEVVRVIIESAATGLPKQTWLDVQATLHVHRDHIASLVEVPDRNRPHP
jgi:hypothetical protein